MRDGAWLRLVYPLVLAGALIGCATGGKARFSSAKMCEAAGGTYDRLAKTCDAPAVNSRKASEMCAAHGGWYQADLDTCEVEGRD